MARLTSNKLLPILGGVVLVTTGAVAAGSLFTNGDPTPVPRAAPPDALEMPDGDTAVDTIRTLRAELMAANEKFENVVEQNERLLDDNQDLRQEQTSLRQDITSDLEEKLATASSDQSSQIDKTVSEFSEQLASLQQSLTINKPAAPAVADQEGSSSALPSANSYPIVGAPNATNYVWIEPLDGASGTAPLAPSGFAPSGSPSALNAGDATGGVEALRDGTAAAGAEPLAPTPYFTINNLATLAGSTAFTALIGRVPINGQIADPVPFRVLVGRENLAASGLRVPDEIASMVFEGVAIGDWTLGCVEGSLRTATFIFEDGTIRTVSGGSGQDGRLGYIADEFGTPCVAGEKISNAAGYLTAQIALAAGGGAADAFAAAQTAQVVDGGAVVSAVVGDAAQFALGRAASNATQEVQRYLADRLSNTFDAVYVPPGQKVGLLIQQEIAIDYDPNGRKLDHAQGGVGRARNLD